MCCVKRKVWISPKAEKLLFVRAHTKQARGILVFIMKEEEEDKEEEEEEKEQQRRKKEEISSLLSKCRSLLEHARRTVAEARIGFFTHHPGNNFVGNENENENENEDVNEKKKKRDAMMTESLERTLEECSATVAEIERRVLVFANNNKNETKIVLVFKTETRTIRRELEEVRKHLTSFKCDDDDEKRRIPPPLIPEPQKDASRKEREDIVREALREETDQFVYWKKSAKMYLEKAKKKMNSVATKTKTAVKKFAATTAATTTTTTTKNEERYSDAQRQRERREEEEIRRLRRYGYENATTNNNTGEQSVFEGDLDEKNEEEKEDDDDARRKALFATITPTVTTMTSSLPSNNDNNNNRNTDNTRYDINAARNSTLAANRSAIALEDSLKQAERAEQAGRDTLENLRRQRETLQRTAAQMQNAKDTVEENRKIVKKMSHWSRLGC